MKDVTRWALLAVTFTALVAGGVAWLLDARAVADGCWIAGTVAALIPALWWVVAALGAGRLGVDVLAVLSLAGALAVGEYLAGALIGVMLATGQALDAAAERRATRTCAPCSTGCRTRPGGAPPMASRWSSWRRSGSTTCSSSGPGGAAGRRTGAVRGGGAG